tara:strand:- start:171 stop:416 length:246 start_codon:yes stop_codon:yes gene_type:complete
MAIKGSVRQQNNIKTTVKGKKEIVASTVKLNALNLSLGDLADVNTLNKTDGAMLMYNGTTNQYENKNELENENLIIGGGAF